MTRGVRARRYDYLGSGETVIGCSTWGKELRHQSEWELVTPSPEHLDSRRSSPLNMAGWSVFG